MIAVRGALVALGVSVAVYGAWLLTHEQDPERWLDAIVWLVAGVLLHDVVLSGALLVVVAVGARLLPRAYAAPATVAMIVLGSVTLMAVPVLGRFGALPDNPTLLDRSYVTAWVVLALTISAAVLVAGWLRSRAHDGQADASREDTSQADAGREDAGREDG